MLQHVGRVRPAYRVGLSAKADIVSVSQWPGRVLQRLAEGRAAVSLPVAPGPDVQVGVDVDDPHRDRRRT